MISVRLQYAAIVVASQLAALGHAAAETWSDAASGLRINPPAGYTVHPMSLTAPFSVRASVKEPGDRDTGCQVAFEPLPQNARLSQADINRIAGDADWRERARWSIAAFSNVSEEQPYTQSGIVGVSMIAEMKPTFAAPDRAKALRNFMAILETAKGRTTIICTAEKEAFEHRRAAFLEAAHGVEPPRP
ncbi:hypothetical protein I3J27_13335 [Bradyrhizobium xenonodulans]|uniref:Uncharacterized protein n=1 Tax=Bradyrhizobium xenonodulans TaxID=2736875 RepID=A0ABY7MSG4_9BRAD|nr:hypothetical protein [Bradyrhizobium xenonodulans]WBL81353.1 hypothetical protein I3J27_13335 [Bradyrhizobium xenonodulans]